MEQASLHDLQAGAMSQEELTELAMAESTIARGMKTFIEVGNALVKIRDQRLYRERHGTFEDYCQERWGMSRSHANRLIGASEVVEDLAPMGAKSELPQSERQARELKKAPPEQRAKVWKEAQERSGSTQPTAKQVKQAVAEVLPLSPSPPAPAPRIDWQARCQEAEAEAARLGDQINYQRVQLNTYRGLAERRHAELKQLRAEVKQLKAQNVPQLTAAGQGVDPWQIIAIPRHEQARLDEALKTMRKRLSPDVFDDAIFQTIINLWHAAGLT